MKYIHPKTKQESLTHYVDLVVAEMNYGLSIDQQMIVQQFFKSDSYNDLIPIIKEVFNLPALVTLPKDDPRYSKVKRYLSKLKRGTTVQEFTREEIAKIRQMSAEGQTTADIVDALYPRGLGHNLGSVSKTITEFCKAIGSYQKTHAALQDDPDTFTPAESTTRVIKYINEAQINSGYPAEPKKLTRDQRKCVQALKGYMKSPRFVQMVNSISDKNEKNLFIMEFVRATYDKPDLNSEDINSYITLCDMYHQEVVLKKQIDFFNQEIQTAMSSSRGNVAVIPQPLIKSLETFNKELGEIRRHGSQLRSQLSNTRAERLKNQREKGISMLEFAMRWREEENRVYDLRIAEAHKVKLENEQERIASFDDIIAEVRGGGVEELLEI